MARAAAGLVVAAVVALVGVAALDAVRGDGSAPSEQRDRIEGRDRLSEQLSALGAEGVLVSTGPECRSFHAVRLPSLRAERLPRGGIREQCSLALSPNGALNAAPHWHWSPDGRARAACRGGAFVDVVGGFTRIRRTWDGCTPAWRPDGALTVVRDGAVVRAEDGETLVPRRAVLAAAAHHPATPPSGRFSRVDVVDAVWHSELVVVLALTVHYPDGRVLPQQLVAAFEGGGPTWLRPLPGEPVVRLAHDPGGRYLVAEPGRLLGADGRPVRLPAAVRQAHALAFSPDGRLLAAAVGDSVVIMELERAGAAVRLPMAARDVAWR